MGTLARKMSLVFKPLNGLPGNDFGYLVWGDGCCHDAGEFPLGGNLR